ncbi:serine-type D-Ala-D-Ala carboxypeptidase [Vibrio ostreicida]|uniref:Serine-type D-Ala-D-Ala carboxypeptidase n=1 Tax=Vibrio ostreicida TaxID=526588 RepID=A0ABT8BRW3_9VIBR|nr:serine-type D-Ala-D-Ala carboxypeptidase [Vibrio ostreicida]MDN3609104.1 serine-type D-Ala-D-Ala carboxypeptidase [Vibrio ostreicida]NPD07998.1 serine-type D-Ala-D-Ala carboxypeptidase [Vibrio ostreicida]
MQLLNVFLIVFLFLSPIKAFAYAPLSELPHGSRATLLVESLVENDTLLDTSNSQQYFPPASTLKLVTALAAKLELGDNFYFETTLEKADDDLALRFSGDPTLKTKNLKQLFAVAKRNGLREIRGDIWLDNRAFTGYNRGIGWPWDILGVCYSAPAAAISLDRNCVQASIYTQDDGRTRVYVPEHYPVYVTTQAKSVTTEQKTSTQCDLELISSPDNHYQLNGCLVKRDKPLPLKFAVQDPELYTQRMLHNILKELNITFNGSVRIGSLQRHNTTLLATHRSPPLVKLLETMLKRSDNLIADNVTKTLGAKFYIQPGSFSNGTKAIKQIIFAHTGVNLDAAPLADGSGLSRNNRLTSQSMAQILRYIWANDDTLNLIAMMPVSGESGTLKYRRSMRQQPIKGAFIAKSGSVYGSYNMAGFGLDSSGKPATLFVQYVADYLPPKPKPDQKPTEAPITKFETLFYQDIVKLSHSIPKNLFTTVK